MIDTYPLTDESTSCLRGTDRIRVLSCRHSVRSTFPLYQKGKINILQIDSLCNISQFHSYHLPALYSEPLYLSDTSSLRMFTQPCRGHTQKAWVLWLWHEQAYNKKMYIGKRCEFKCLWESTAATIQSGEKQEHLDFHARFHFLPVWLHILWEGYTNLTNGLDSLSEKMFSVYLHCTIALICCHCKQFFRRDPCSELAIISQQFHPLFPPLSVVSC